MYKSSCCIEEHLKIGIYEEIDGGSCFTDSSLMAMSARLHVLWFSLTVLWFSLTGPQDCCVGKHPGSVAYAQGAEKVKPSSGYPFH